MTDVRTQTPSRSESSSAKCRVARQIQLRGYRPPAESLLQELNGTAAGRDFMLSMRRHCRTSET